MSKLSLRDELTALEGQYVDLNEKRSALAAIAARPLPDFDQAQSDRIVAKARIDDQLHGTRLADGIAAKQAALAKDFAQATAERNRVTSEIRQIDVTLEVLREEIQRITRELSGIAKEKALQEFLKCRDKLAQMAVTVRKQVIECGAWAELADQRERCGDIQIPRFSSEKSPEYFLEDIRGWRDTGFSLQDFINARADALAEELEAA